MGSDLANPKTWVPYHTNSKDCSQEKLCTVNCPQGCNNNRFFLTPPPALPFSSFSSSSSSPSPVGLTFSPLVIAIIGILASAFLLISYYAIITTYCGNTSSTATRGRRRRSSMIIRPHDYGVEFSSYHPSSRTEEPWYNYNYTRNSGLDEAVIKSFATFKVGERTVNNNNNGRSGGQEEEYCCVCLGEFEMGERLRLLPKCDHAFHLVCIDTWLKSHSNCPLCRAGIVLTPCTTTTMSDQVAGTHEATVCDQQTRNLDLVAEPSSSSSSMEGQQLVESSRNTDTVVVITEERDLEDGLGTTTTTPGTMNYSVRRSFSMDHVRGGRRLCGVSVGEILSRSNREMEEDEVWSELQQGVDMIGSDSRLLQPQEESSSSSGSVCEAKSKVLISCSVASIKRSFSSGRFSVPCCTCSSNGRGRQSVVPL